MRRWLRSQNVGFPGRESRFLASHGSIRRVPRPKHEIYEKPIWELAFAAVLGCQVTSIQPALAQGTAFTYQGQLANHGLPANGQYDFAFALFNTNNTTLGQVGATVTNLEVGVTNGLFTTTLDFGTVFAGAPTWLAIGVRTNGGAVFTPLSPLQELTPVLYAITAASAGSVAAANLTGTVALGQLPGAVLTNGASGVSVSGTFSGNGTGLTGVALLAGGNSFSGNQVVNNGSLSVSKAFVVEPRANATGEFNTFAGASAGQNVTSGSANTMFGYGAGHALTTESGNTFLGFGAGQVSHGDNNTYLGENAGLFATGGGNTVVGANALESLLSGGQNVALGQNAGQALTNGNNNVYIASGGGTNESAIIRIGAAGTHTDTYLTGVIHGDASGLTNLTAPVSLAQLPAAVLTNGASGVNVSGAFSGNGAGLTNLNAAQFSGLSAATPPATGGPILNMVWIVPGTFIMGSPTSEADRGSDETQHVVTLTNGFWMGHHPVTQGEYLAVMGNNPSYFTGDLTLPVEKVSWFNASNFCYTLTQTEQSAGRLPVGWVYRLPTEAEWEYCCRALTTTRFYFGNDPGDGNSLTNYAWYSVNSGFATHPVGQLLPNAWGLVDMAGNVFEWCRDWYGPYPSGNVTYNPQGWASGPLRVVRSGGWTHNANYCRSAIRSINDSSNTGISIGFRVVLAPGQP